MKIKVKENNEENYDYIFYVMELLEILGFHEMGITKRMALGYQFLSILYFSFLGFALARVV